MVTGPTETEIKLRLGLPVPALREKLAGKGYHEVHPRQLQSDQVYDLPGGALRQSQRLLRLRRWGGDSVLTYKGPPRPGPHKSREEVEARVADPAGFEAILAGLGYQPSFYYEKFRTEFRSGEEPGVIALDETPIGTFLELEGSSGWIDRTAAWLGYRPDDYITASYAGLFFDYRASHPGELSAMRF